MADYDTTGEPVKRVPPDSDAAYGEELSRGEFLAKATVGVGALIGAVVTVPLAGMALAPAVKGPGERKKVSIGKVEDFPEGKYTKAVFSFGDPNAPDAYVQQRVAFVRRNGSDFKDKKTGRHEKYTVLSNRCVHLGCPVQEAGGTFTCPCHGGAYDADGYRTAGPPVRPLDKFDVVEENGELFIVREFSRKNDGTPAAPFWKDAEGYDVEGSHTRGPGQQSSGLLGWLYPVQPGDI